MSKHGPATMSGSLGEIGIAEAGQARIDTGSEVDSGIAIGGVL